MTDVPPLTPDEEALWRALMRLTVTLQRELNDDLVRARGMTAVEYKTLMFLSEAPKAQLRISEMSTSTALSISRMSRLLDSLQDRGLVEKRRAECDGRGSVACLTEHGANVLQSAWPDHLAAVRRLFMDVLSDQEKEILARALSTVAAHIDAQS